MSSVVRLHDRPQVDALWQEYCALAQAVVATPELMTDRRHMEATARAHRRWQNAYLAAEARS